MLGSRCGDTECNSPVTGANRGLGAEFVRQLIERGAAKVYAAARRAEAVPGGETRIVPICLDITDEAMVAAVANAATDVDVVINNAGLMSLAPIRAGSLFVDPQFSDLENVDGSHLVSHRRR
ncbi:SDR family NAD(P)-dependent oxidoreductase [Mycolicibacterium baixiangningiae]|uniref:SDR family NAD(P)-dependent oxidoreductase n=1 Tax=Mycolicibacterium baixiangningiae TaxID=2761578 RepID=UPI0018D04D92|nr:SDR family NAD(P)-dependent oxidoreductase [Mycolicibacterium baixiangningiae]